MSWGIVIAVGPGKYLENGTLRKVDIKVGDNVLLPEYGGSTVKLSGDQEYHIYRDDDILGILEEKVSQWFFSLSFTYLEVHNIFIIFNEINNFISS